MVESIRVNDLQARINDESNKINTERYRSYFVQGAMLRSTSAGLR